MVTVERVTNALQTRYNCLNSASTLLAVRVAGDAFRIVNGIMCIPRGIWKFLDDKSHTDLTKVFARFYRLVIRNMMKSWRRWTISVTNWDLRFWFPDSGYAHATDRQHYFALEYARCIP